LTNEVSSDSPAGAVVPKYTATALKSATDISVADGVEITIQALDKHPTDRILQSAGMQLLLSLHAHGKLANRVGEKLLKLRTLAAEASRRPADEYLPLPPRLRVPVKEYAVKLLNACDTLVGDKGGQVRPVSVKIVSTYQHEDGKNKYTLFDMRVEWDGEEVKWKLAKRYSEFLILHERLCCLFALAPFPPKAPSLDAAALEQRRTALQVWLQSIVDKPEARQNDMFLDWIGAHKHVPSDARAVVPLLAQTLPAAYGHGGKVLAFDEESGLLAVGTQYLKKVSTFSTLRDWNDKLVPKGALQVYQQRVGAAGSDVSLSASAASAIQEANKSVMSFVSLSLHAFTSEVTSVCIISSWSCIAVGLFSGCILIYRYALADVNAGGGEGGLSMSVRRVVSAHSSPIQGLIFDPKTNLLLSSSEKGVLALFDMAEGVVTSTATAASMQVDSMAYDSVHQLAMLGTTSSTVLVYDVAQTPPKLVQTIAVTQQVDGPREPGALLTSPPPKVDVAVGKISALSFDSSQVQLHAHSEKYTIVLQLEVDRAESLDRSVGSVTVSYSQVIKVAMQQQFNIRCAEFESVRQQLLVAGYNGATSMMDLSNVSKPRVIAAWMVPTSDVITWLQWVDRRCCLITTGKDGNTRIISFAHFPGFHELAPKSTSGSGGSGKSTSQGRPAAAWLSDDAHDDDPHQQAAMVNALKTHTIDTAAAKMPSYVKKEKEATADGAQ
jgi:WD40 repeat protein